jgi:putative heme-binding domain-containing protein
LLPPLLSYSDGPAGFKIEPGTALSAAQRGMAILNEFPSGKMRAFRAARDGATYKMVDARVLHEGVMGIGLSWHPDGSFMMADWMGGYPLDNLGALWRVDTKDGARSPERVAVHQVLRDGLASAPVSKLVTLLAHRDQRVRLGAQLELAKQGAREALLAAARVPTPAADLLPGAETQQGRPAQLARFHAIWGYGQLLRRGAADVAAVVPLLKDADPEIRAQVAKILGDAPAAAKTVARELIPLLADAEPRPRLQAAIALGKLEELAAVDALFAFATRDGSDPVLRHAATAGLTGCATPAQLAAKQTDSSPVVRLVSVVALRRQAAPEIAAFLNDTDALVVAEAARAIHDGTAIPQALPALAAIEITGQPEAIARRVVNTNFRLGTKEAATRLLALALQEDAPAFLREEALTLLRFWKSPPPLDRVDGYARKFQPASIDDVLTAKLEALLQLRDAKLKTLAIEIMSVHALKASPHQLAGIVTDAQAADALRAQALTLLAADRGDPAFAGALDAALAAGAPPALHRSGLEALLSGRSDRLVAEATATLAERSVPEKQHALALLARAGTPVADQVLAAQGDALLAGTCPPTLQLDVLEALQVRAPANPALAAKLGQFTASPAAVARRELLEGGSVIAGREIVQNHLNANCIACHAVEATGSEVGPSLRTIGATRDRAYLLEALLTPSAKIAPGYGIVNVTLTDKSEVAGALAADTPESVIIHLFDGTQRQIARAQVASVTTPVSIMPPMDGILQPREIRDVVSYLASLTGNKKAAETEH